MAESKLDCHQANLEEKCAAFANVYEFWGNELPLDEYVQWRLNSIHHQRASWYVGTVEGSVVTSLGVFPMFLSFRGDVQATMFIGAVHTHPDYRKRGYAADLIAYAEQDQATNNDVRWSLLFSDINPNYYARQGYQISNAPNVCISRSEFDGWETEPFEIATELDQMIEIFEANHQSQTCHLYRPREYWDFLAVKHAKDCFLWLICSGQRQGYIHLRQNNDLACLEDFAVADYDSSTLEQLAGSVSSYANKHGISEVHGWFPLIVTDHPWLRFSERKTEITMWKSLTNVLLTSHQSDELSFLRHIDHV
ncbi:MAG: hypothetical protein CMJ76_04480 [Planctomycetaceae bacterium]|nr:hypothetical protein [Planctomycetaceae bacterium]|tara:strand:- start:294 stop:1217 length:924 start_codon:yes stop_codon:yes gene_type:complete